MISYLEGNILLKKDKFIIVIVSGIGYQVFLSGPALLKLPESGSDVKLFCFQNIKEDALDLYGFMAHSELEFFETLMDIRGVGPKSALAILDVAPMKDLKAAIKEGRPDLMTRASGIGSKTGERIILELRNNPKLNQEIAKNG